MLQDFMLLPRWNIQAWTMVDMATKRLIKDAAALVKKSCVKQL